MASAGVSWRAPPKGMSTVAAPMVESKRSTRPLFEARLMSPMSAARDTSSESASHTASTTGSVSSLVASKARSQALSAKLSSAGAGTATAACFGAPLLARNSRLTSTIVSPRQCMRTRGSSVTTATGVASRFSSWASAMKASTSSGASATAMRSCDSEMASSVPSSPSYFLGTASRLMSRPSANSPMATDTPPAPKSLQRLIMRHASPRRNRRWILRSTGALPFCTSAPQLSNDSTEWALEEPVAPPMPSRPVRPPRSTTTSPGAGVSRRTWSAGVAPTTAPISMRLAA